MQRVHYFRTTAVSSEQCSFHRTQPQHFNPTVCTCDTRTSILVPSVQEDVCITEGRVRETRVLLLLTGTQQSMAQHQPQMEKHSVRQKTCLRAPKEPLRGNNRQQADIINQCNGRMIALTIVANAGYEGTLDIALAYRQSLGARSPSSHDLLGSLELRREQVYFILTLGQLSPGSCKVDAGLRHGPLRVKER